MSLAPIILFVYNRLEHTKRTIESLLKNTLSEKSDLFIYSDGAKNETDLQKVLNVRNHIQNIYGFKKIEVVERDKNLGLAKSIIMGVSEVFERYNKVIVLEDDIITSKYFLNFLNDALEFYENNEIVFSISGYNFPIKIPINYPHEVYLSPRPSSWGWGTWRNKWNKVDWELKDFNNYLKDKSFVQEFKKGGEDLIRMMQNQMKGQIDSWAIIWALAHSINEAYCLYPLKSRAKNIGADKSGVHLKKTKKFNVKLMGNDSPITLIEDIKPDEEVLMSFRAFFKKGHLSSLYNKIRIIINSV